MYPRAGQTADQQAADERECKGWALDRSGYDPMVSTEAGPAPEKSRGGLLGGAAAGAAIGAIVGNSDDAKKGAAIGGLLGGMRQSSRNRSRQQAYEQEQRWDEAEDTYLSIANRSELDFQVRDALASAARIRSAQGDNEGAIELYEQVLGELDDNAPERGQYEMRIQEIRSASNT